MQNVSEYDQKIQRYTNPWHRKEEPHNINRYIRKTIKVKQPAPSQTCIHHATQWLASQTKMGRAWVRILTRKCLNHTLQTNPVHHEEETQHTAWRPCGIKKTIKVSQTGFTVFNLIFGRKLQLIVFSYVSCGLLVAL